MLGSADCTPPTSIRYSALLGSFVYYSRPFLSVVRIYFFRQGSAPFVSSGQTLYVLRKHRASCGHNTFAFQTKGQQNEFKRGKKMNKKVKQSTQVVSSFGGGDGDGTVSLPKFLSFLGKEYGRGVRARRGEGGEEAGGGGGRSLAGRLRLILKKVFDGIGSR